MDLEQISPDTLLARGKYSTVNGEYKTLMSNTQALTQQACDALRRGLQTSDHEQMRAMFEDAQTIVQRLIDVSGDLALLKAQKESLWDEAWGKK